MTAGEVAEAIVESVVDIVALAREEIDEETFWRRLAVTGRRAAGGALGGQLGAHLATHIAGDASHRFQGVLTMLGQWAGREYLGRLAEDWFGDE